MDFGLDETCSAVVALAAETLGRDGAGWSDLVRAGLVSLAMPVRVGGEGFGVLETSLVLTEIGRRAAPLPGLATLALGVLPLARLGTLAQQDEHLGAVAVGDALLTAAVREPSDSMPVVPATVARREGDRFVVSGTKIGVPYAAEAARVLVPVTIRGGGVAGVLMVEPDAAGVRVTATASSSGMPEYTVEFEDVSVPAEELLGRDPSGRTVRELYAFALAGACALGDGLAAGALELTTAHVRQREQFGKPLATFQAVTQQIADVYTTARTLHLAARSACWRLGSGRDAGYDLDVAAYWLAEELPPALQVCHHLHGGLGVDIAYPLHRYYSMGKDLARFVGGALRPLERLAAVGQ